MNDVGAILNHFSGRPWPEVIENDANIVDFGSLGALGLKLSKVMPKRLIGTEFLIDKPT